MKAQAITDGKCTRNARTLRVAVLTAAAAMALAMVPGAAAQGNGVVAISATQCDAPNEFDERTNEGALHEWIEVTNHADFAVSLEGWTLEGDRDGAVDNDDYPLPAFVLESGATVRIVTGVGTDDASTIYLGQEQGIWRNAPPETVWLNSTAGASHVVVCLSDDYSGGVTVDAPDETGAGDAPTGDAAEAPCVADVRAAAEGENAIRVTWAAHPDAAAYHVHAVNADGTVGEELAVVDASETTHVLDGLDAGTTHGVTVAANGAPVSECADAEATTIPFFQGVVPFVAATLGTVGAMALAQRKRA